MAAKYFILQQSVIAAVPAVDGVNCMIIVAESAADAKAIANSKSQNDANGAWSNATATELAAGVDLEGWKLNVRVVDNVTREDVVNVTVTGAASATFDSIGALAVTALNATTPIAGAAYASNTLKVAETTDGLGDNSLYVTFTPPPASNENPTTIPGFLGAIVHEGASGDALTVAFAADAYTIPKINAQLRSGL